MDCSDFLFALQENLKDPKKTTPCGGYICNFTSMYEYPGLGTISRFQAETSLSVSKGYNMGNQFGPGHIYKHGNQWETEAPPLEQKMQGSISASSAVLPKLERENWRQTNLGFMPTRRPGYSVCVCVCRGGGGGGGGKQKKEWSFPHIAPTFGECLPIQPARLPFDTSTPKKPRCGCNLPRGLETKGPKEVESNTGPKPRSNSGVKTCLLSLVFYVSK